MLHLGNCIELMRSLPDASVDSVITDPPYGTTALAFDKQPIDWEAWWAEVRRITKPPSPIVLFAQQPFTTDLIVSNRKMFRYLLVWQKTMPTGFLDANARPLRAHEDILVFAHRGTVGSNKERPTYNPQKVAGEKRKKTRQAVRADHYSDTPRIPEGTYNDRHPTSVLEFPEEAETQRHRDGAASVYGRPRTPSVSDGLSHPTSVVKFSNHNGAYWGSTEDVVRHPTAKPIDLMRWLVASYSNPGDLVLDPFAGSGTTGVACVQLGRQFVGMELDPTYHALASQRIAEAQPDAVTITLPEPVAEGLFASD